MKIRTFLIPVFCVAFLFTNAQDVNKDFKTESISIFKNGTSFIQKSGTVKTTSGKYKMTKNLPSALFGTFWFHSNDNSVKNVVSYKDEVITKKKVNPVNFFEMLENNKGQKVKIHIGKEEVIEGTVLFLEELKTDEDKTDREISQAAMTRQGIVTIQHDAGYLSIASSEIRRVDFPTNPNTSFEKETKELKPIIEIDLKRNAASNQLDMMYLTGGLKWEPTYLVELINDTKAKLTLRAEVANDVEDIENTDINFVVGVPNFKYANRLSSLVELFGKMVGIDNRAATQFSNASFSAETYEIEAPQAGTTDLFKDATGSSNEDLFFYSLKNFSLKKGGRGYFQMFEADIDIKHIYECNLAKNATTAHHYRAKNIHQASSQNPTTHSVKVINNSTFPWTSGAAMVVKKDGIRKPISQDRMFYTPVKGHSFIKLTEAPDIQISHDEKSTNRVDNAKKKDKRNFHLVTVEGKVKIRNYKNKKVNLNVHRTIIGALQDSSEKWLKATQAIRNYGVNDVTDVCWELTMKPGEEKEIKYDYKVYVTY